MYPLFYINCITDAIYPYDATINCEKRNFCGKLGFSVIKLHAKTSPSVAGYHSFGLGPIALRPCLSTGLPLSVKSFKVIFYFFLLYYD